MQRFIININDMVVYHDGYDDDKTINVIVIIILQKWSKMMVTDIESLPRGGMGGVVHTVCTVENSEHKISQTYFEMPKIFTKYIQIIFSPERQTEMPPTARMDKMPRNTSQ